MNSRKLNADFLAHLKRDLMVNLDRDLNLSSSHYVLLYSRSGRLLLVIRNFFAGDS